MALRLLKNQDGIEDRSQGIYKDRDIITWDPDRELKEWRGPKDKSRLDKLKKMFEENRAQGGRIGYNEGGNDKDHRKAALAELYKPRMQEGGTPTIPEEFLEDLKRREYHKFR